MSTELRSLSDDEVIEMIGASTNFDRELLVDCLGFSTGERGVAFLRLLLEERGRGSSHLRSAATNALANRLGMEAAPELAAELHRTEAEQVQAVSRMLRMDAEGRFAPQLLDWLQRRLRKPARHPSEIAGMLLYAQRCGELGAMLPMLERYHRNLSRDELDWLEKAWPRKNRDQFRRTPTQATEPEQSVLVEWYCVAASHPPIEPLELDDPVMADEYTETAIRRARRRLERA